MTGSITEGLDVWDQHLETIAGEFNHEGKDPDQMMAEAWADYEPLAVQEDSPEDQAAYERIKALTGVLRF